MARVEGEGALTIHLRDGRVDDVQLRIFEAPRFFEALLRGRAIAEVPDITARICGICPVAYQMSSCHALEALLGITCRTRCGRCAGCCIAASGSRATCCTSPSCTHPTSWATRVPSRWPRTDRNSPTAARRAAIEEGRQRHRRSGRGPRDPSDQRAAGRVLSCPLASRSCGTGGAVESGAGDRPGPGSLDGELWTFRRSSTTTSSWRCGTSRSIR